MFQTKDAVKYELPFFYAPYPFSVSIKNAVIIEEKNPPPPQVSWYNWRTSVD
jgi:hypothetical protein